MRKRIYLDDERSPIPIGWIICRDYYQFVDKINEIGLENIEVISLDHDLGDSAIEEFINNGITKSFIDYNNITEKTGYDCAKWLVELSMDLGIPLPQIFVHSANPVGALNIIKYINNYLRIQGLEETCSKIIIPFTC